MRSSVCSNPPTGLSLLNKSFQPHGVTRSSQFARFRSFRLRAGSFDEFEDPLEVENIDREYCNDFVCYSSPLVEETVKMFAVDLQRPGRWTLNRFPENVIYQVTLSHSFPTNELHSRTRFDRSRGRTNTVDSVGLRIV